MTAKLAQAAMNARYLFQVYCQFEKPVPASMLEKVCAEIVEALEEFQGPEQPKWDSRATPEKYDRFTGSYMTETERFGQ